MSDLEQILSQCTNVLPGHGREKSMKQVMQDIADALTSDEDMDRYGEGDYLKSFEAEVAALFGKEAAVFMPSGTMAQQIALRIWCERRRNFTIAMHPTTHPEFAENGGYSFIHGLTRLRFGAPEFVGDRQLTVRDFEKLGQDPGAALLELPYRELGGKLPSWDELLAIQAWAQAHGVPLHMDGARLWQCRPFYQKTYAEIASLFDSVYVSFYKDLGGLSGAMLLGSADFIKEARLWQVRHGGRLYTLAPIIVSARSGLLRVEPQIDGWVIRTQEIAAVLSRFDEITIDPNPPHVNFFRMYVRGDVEALNRRHLELAKETGTFVFHGLSPASIPGIGVTEIHCWENAAKFDMAALTPFITKLLQKPSEGVAV